MRKTVLLLALLFVATVGFSQVQLLDVKGNTAQELKKNFTPQLKFDKGVTKDGMPEFYPTATRTSKAVLLNEGFEGGTLPAGWLNVDQDGDTYVWGVVDAASGYVPHTGSYLAFSESWVGPTPGTVLFPDNWLITPQIAIPSAYSVLKFWVKGQDPDYAAENYSVLVSTTGTTVPADFTEVYTEILPDGVWKEVSISLAAYDGQDIYIAFRHWNVSDMFQIVLDDITVEDIAPYDAAVTAIVAPTGTMAPGNYDVVVTIKNFGGANLTALDIDYEIGTETGTYNWTGDLAYGAQEDVTIVTGFDFNTLGSYAITATANLAGDANSANDEAAGSVNIADIVFYESFDAEIPVDWAVTTSNVTYPWQYVTTGNYPTIAPQAGAGMLKYASFSASASNWSILYSPMVSLTKNATVTFWMYRDNGYLTNADRVEVYANTQMEEAGAILLGTVNRSINLEPVVAENGWYEYSFEVSSEFNGQDYYLYFKGISAYGNNMYVDEISLAGEEFVPAANDAGITAIAPSGTFYIGAKDIEVTLRNFGADPITAIDIDWDINGTTGTYEWTGDLASGVAETVTITNFDFTAGGEYTIMATANLAGDADNTNDSKTIVVNVLEPLVAPFFEGFENGNTQEVAIVNWTQVSEVGSNLWLANTSLTTYNRTPRSGSWNAFIRWSNTRWMFTHGIVLEVGKAYNFSMYARQDGATAANSNITVKFGDEPTIVGMTNDVVAETGIVNGDYQLLTGTITPSATGIYFVGIKGFMNGTPYYISVDDISITELLDHDLGVQSIQPTFVLSGSTVTPKVAVKNHGMNNESVWSVTLTDGDTYTETIDNPGELVSGETMMLDFPDWTPADGTHTLTATLTFAEDENVANDEMVVNVLVGSYDDAYVGNTTDLTYGTINLETGDVTNISTIGTAPFPMAEEFNGQAVYRIYNDLSIGVVNPLGEYAPIGSMTGVAGTPTGLAYDWDNDIMYVVVLDGSSLPQLCTLDVNSLALTLVGTGAEGAIIGIDFAEDGYIYGPSINPDNLYRIDPATGATTVVGPIGIDINYGQDVSYDPIEEKLYSITVGGAAKFGYYDLSTGAFVEISDKTGLQHATFVVTKVPLPKYEVVFTVTDGADPIEGAVITIGSKVLTTDATGIASKTFINGEYNYTVAKFGFELYNGSFTVEDDVEAVGVTLVALSVFPVTFNIENVVEQPLNADITIYSEDVEVYSGTAVDGTITFNDVPVGNYTFDVVFNGYLSQLEQELIVDAEEVVNVTLIEDILAPYALMVDVNHAELSALFSWNNVDAYFADSFEDGTFDAWAEFIQGSGTPGEGGNAYWFPSTEPDGGVVPDGSYVAMANWGYDINTWLVSPLTMVNEGAGVIFHWYSSYYWSVDPNPNAQLLVKVSTDGGDTWTPIWNWQEIGVWTNFTWYETTVPLDAYVGQAVIVAVNLVANDNAVSQIDNVRIGTPTKFGTFAISSVPNVAENAKSAGNVKTSINKAFVGYNVYLDAAETPANAEPITETSYLFEGLAIGAHTAGVEAVYSSGVSETITIDFEVLATYNVTFTVTDIDLAPIADAVITLGDVTNAEGDYYFEDVPVGVHNYSVAKAGFNVGAGTVEVVDQDVTEDVILTVVGLNSNTFANFSAYPNPFSNQITISNPAAVSRVVVTNLLGQVVLNVNTNGAAQIETGNLSSGIYLVTFEAASGERFVSKMIKK